jgi:hypothetical protein
MLKLNPKLLTLAAQLPLRRWAPDHEIDFNRGTVTDERDLLDNGGPGDTRKCEQRQYGNRFGRQPDFAPHSDPRPH